MGRFFPVVWSIAGFVFIMRRKIWPDQPKQLLPPNLLSEGRKAAERDAAPRPAKPASKSTPTDDPAGSAPYLRRKR